MVNEINVGDLVEFWWANAGEFFGNIREITNEYFVFENCQDIEKNYEKNTIKVPSIDVHDLKKIEKIPQKDPKEYLW